MVVKTQTNVYEDIIFVFVTKYRHIYNKEKQEVMKGIIKSR